ncbi:MAG: transporter substrate-binding domain-containing protein [Arcobacteraceae bacterium]|nr:transporter substrate-binding domain-containing protein [Arcobacteraceae bacterium]
MKLFYLLINLLFFSTFLFGENLKQVSVQFEWKHQFEFAGFYMAKEKGFYNDIGANVEFKEFHNDTNIVDDVISGKSTFGTSSSSLILEKLHKKPVVLLASYFKQNVLALAVKKNIKSLQDLKGKKIMAVDWELEHTSIGAMFKDAKIKKSDYTFLPHDFGIDKFVNGEVDAMTIFTTSQPYLLDKVKAEYNIINPADYGIYSYDVELFTNQNLVNSNPQFVKNFIEATKKGWEYAFSHKEETVNLIYDKYSKRKSKEALLYEAKATEKIFKKEIFTIGAIVPELLKLNTEMFTKLGLIYPNANILEVLHEYCFDYERKINRTIYLSDIEKEYLKNHQVLKVQNEKDWAPFNFRENGEPNGFSIDFMKLVASKIGIEVEFVSGYDWATYLEMLKTNKLDAMLNIAKTDNRERYFSFTTPYFDSMDSVFVRKENLKLKSLKDFEGKRLAVVKGFYEEETIKRYYPRIKVITYPNTLSSIRAVLFNEVDGLVDSYSVVSYLLSKEGINDIYPSCDMDEQGLNLKLNLAVNKRNEILQGILQKGIDGLSQDEIMKLKIKWFSNLEKDKKTILFNSKEIEFLNKKKQITMCVDPNWEPFEKIKDGNHIGMAADFMKLFSKTMGVDIVLVPTDSWSESLQFAMNRKCDILSLAMETPKRKTFMNFTTPYIKAPLVLVTKNGVPFIEDFHKIIDKSLSITKDYAFVEILKEKYPKIKLIEVDSLEEGLKKVQNKEVFGHIDTLISVSNAFQSNYIGELKVSAKFDESWNMGVAVRNDNLILLDIFNKAIENISQDDYQSIYNKWVAIKYEKGVDNSLVWKISIFSLFFILVMLYWVGRLKKLNYQLDMAKIKAESAVNAKANFLSNVSHEVRTPMNAILGMLYVLKRTSLNPKQLEYANKIESASNILLKLINDILDFSKLEAKKIELHKVSFELKSLLFELDNIISIKAEEKGLKFSISVDDDVPNKLYGDSLRLMQILINLISNGIKFTHQGFVALQISKKENNMYQFIVSDSGIGIENSYIDKIFDSFTQADETTTRKYGGTGLGLAISKQFITLMGGKVFIESQLGLGSKFIFEIPLEPQELHGDDKKEDMALSLEETIKLDTKKDLKSIASKDEIEQLFQELEGGLKRKRPIVCEEILLKLDKIKLSQSDEKMCEEILYFVKEYKFKEAIQRIEKRGE